MEDVFVVAVLITLSFCVAKFIEIKYFSEQMKPLKDIVRDSLLVLICALGGAYVYFHFQKNIREFFNIVTETKVLDNASTEVFTDNPSF